VARPVALNAPQYGNGYPGPNCFKQIQISANGKTATATIMDQCPGCGYGDLEVEVAAGGGVDEVLGAS
jgi:hypothetical protein